MARPSKIPSKLEPEILAKAAAKWSSAKIAGWLKKAKGITISGQQVGELIRRHRTEQADTAKMIVRDALTGTLPEYLKILDYDIRQFGRIAKASKDVGDLTTEIKARDARSRAIERALKFVGADQPDEQAFDGLGEIILACRRKEVAP